MNSLLKRRDTDMTTGNVVRLLIDFSIPLLIGNIFQQLYSTVDSIIVGNYIGSEALAAIGSTAPIVNMFIFFFAGMASGAGVVIANYYGAKDNENLHSAVQTTMFFTFILCALFTALGVALTPALLRMMKTPADVFPLAEQYLTMIFAGISTLLIYNMGSGILRAVGDSTRPLYILILCTVVNTVLDLIFIKGFGLGVRSAAVATIISQCISSVIVLYLLCNTDGAYRLCVSQPELNLCILRKICAIGLPSAVQMAITAFSNIFVQSYVNRFGSDAMAGWASYIKIDGFASQPIASLSVAVTTFMGQNIGAKRYHRAKDAPKIALMIGTVVMLVTCIPLIVFAPWFVSLFGDDPEVLYYGTFFMRLITPFYFIMMLCHIYSGALRGSGNAFASMLILLFSFVVCRQIYLYTVWTLTESFTAISLGFPVGWIICATIIIIFYYTRSEIRKNVRLYSSEEDLWSDS